MCIISVNPVSGLANNLGVTPHFTDEKSIKLNDSPRLGSEWQSRDASPVLPDP